MFGEEQTTPIVRTKSTRRAKRKCWNLCILADLVSDFFEGRISFGGVFADDKISFSGSRIFSVLAGFMISKSCNAGQAMARIKFELLDE